MQIYVWKKHFRNIRFCRPTRLFLKQRVFLALSHNVFMEKIIAKHETNVFVFSIQRVCLFPPFDCKRIKKQIAERRNVLDIKLIFENIVFMKPVSMNNNKTNCLRPSEIP